MRTRTRGTSGAVWVGLTLAGALTGACGAERPDGSSMEEPGSREPRSVTHPVAELRVVNLWTHEGASSPLDIYAQPGLGEQERVVEGLTYGSFTTASVPVNATLYAYRSGLPDVGEGYRAESLVAVEDLERDLGQGGSLTVAVEPAPSVGERPGGAMKVFYDQGTTIVGSMPVKEASGALLVADMAPLAMVAGARIDPLRLGVPGHGCLTPAGASPRPGISVSGGGNVVMLYDAPTDASQVAAFGMDDGQCSGPAAIAPIPLQVSRSGRAYLFAYGTTPQDLHLLALPPGGRE